MKRTNLFLEVEKELKKFKRYLTEDNKLLKAKVYEDIMNMERGLLELLLGNEKIKEVFFVEIDGVSIFDKSKFLWFIESKEFLPDSYTSYKNKIGLTDNNGNYISNSNDVVLSFPFKDCYLEGGQEKDKEKRKERFYNEIIASDEVTNMLSPKVFTEARRITGMGVETDITFNEEDNLIIKGNNLIALSSILKRYEGKVKCIYIDPPYNTDNDSFNYNDSFNHSTWLVFMKNRLELAKRLLREDGVIFVQCDDNEQAYLKVLMDEIFGRNSYINTVTVLMKNIAGASGGGEDKRLKKNIEFILIYSKNYSLMNNFNSVYSYIPISKLLDTYKIEGKSWKYNSVLVEKGEKEYIASTIDGDGNEIKIYRRNNFKSLSIKKYALENNITENDVYNFHLDKIYRTTMPQSSIRPRVIKKMNELGLNNDVISIEYIPKTGKNKGELYEQFYSGNKYNLFAWLSDVSEIIEGEAYKKDLKGTYWDFVGETKNLTKEGNIQFTNGKKAEKLIEQIITMSTSPNDLVLDFHLGSGTTCAVAHKMGRRYIGIEQMDYIETVAVERLKKVIDGEQGGISKSVDWKGGGSFVYCKLLEDGSSLIDKIMSSTESEILNIKDEIYRDERIVPYLTSSELEKLDSEFNTLNFEDKKKILIELVNKNKLYVNYVDMEDTSLNVSSKDKKFTKSFYEEG